MDATWLDRLLSSRRASDPLYSGQDGLKMVATSTGLVRVRVVGMGTRCLVFVCDTPVFIEHYQALFELLRADFRIICVELPGMGFSKPSTSFDFSLLSQARSVREVLEAEGIGDAILAFSCVGAYLGLLLAHQLPDVVRGVVSIQAPSWPDEQRWARRIDFRGRGVLAMPVVGQLMVDVARRSLAKRWIEKVIGHSELAPQLVRQANAAFDAGSSWALASLTQAYFGQPAPPFHPVEQKALLVWGERDRSHRHSDPRSGLLYLPRGEFVAFAEAGHFPELEEPQRFADLISGFAASC